MTNLKNGDPVHQEDLGIQSLSQETPPDILENPKKLQIDHDVTEIIQGIKEESKDLFEPDDSRNTAARAVKIIYERNLHICAVVLMKDYIRARECPSSFERQQVLQASIQIHSKCKTIASHLL
jgi:hypothetical protein